MRSFSRITSLLLVLCMMVSLLPDIAFGVDTETTGDGMHFIFSAAGYGSDTDIGYSEISSKDDYYEKLTSPKEPIFSSADTTDPWFIDGHSYTVSGDNGHEGYFFITDEDGYTDSTDTYQPNALSFKNAGSNTISTSLYNKAMNRVAVAIGLDIQESGTFIPELKYHVDTVGPLFDVYLVKRDAVQYNKSNEAFLQRMCFSNGYMYNGKTPMYNNLASAIKTYLEPQKETGIYLGEIDTYAAVEGTQETAFPAYEIPEGKTGYYVLLLRAKNVSAEAYATHKKNMPDYITSIYSFELTPAPEEEIPVISRAELALDNTSLSVGGTANASVKFFLEDGTEYEKDVEYTLSSSDTSVATVDSETGVVTAVSAGNASISVSLTSDTSIKYSVDITVAESTYLKELVPSESAITLYVSGAENSITLTAEAKMNDNSVQSAENYTLTFKSSDSNVASVESSGNTATVTAVSAGEANITISATNEKGDLCSASVPVYVKEKYDGIHFNFSAASWGSAGDIDSAAIEENGDGAEPEYATQNTDPWYIDGQRLISDYRITSENPDGEAAPKAKPNALYWSAVGKYLKPVGGTGNAQEALVLRVKIDRPGVFTPSITYEAGPTSTNYGFFLAPVSASAFSSGYKFYFRDAGSDAEKTAGDIKITNNHPLAACFKAGSQNSKLIELGEQNLYAEETGTVTANFLPVEIDKAGEYYLYIAAKGTVNGLPERDDNTYYDANLYSIDLYPYGTVEGAPVISGAELTLDDSSIPMGRTTGVSVKFFDGNGTAIDKAYKYILESTAPAVASVDEDTGIITALSEGITTIKAALKIKPEITSSAELTVTEKPYLTELIPSRRTVKLYKEGGTKTETITLSAGMSDGGVDPVDPYVGDVSFENSDESVVKMESSGGAATITAVGVGNANITISAVNEKGEPCSVMVPVTVKRLFDGVHFNFSAASWGKSSDIPAEDIKTNGDAAHSFASIDTDPWYIDGQRLIANYRITSDAPDLESFPNSKANALYWNVKGYSYLNVVSSTKSANAALALKVKIDGAGTFTPSITYEAGPTGSRYAFFLAPASAFTQDETGYKFYWRDGTTDAEKTNGDIFITNKSPLQSCFNDDARSSKLIELGELNLYSAESEKRTAVFDPVTIEEAGEYYLYLVARGRVNDKPVASTTSFYDVNLYSVDLYDFTHLKLVSTGAYADVKSPDGIFAGEKVRLVHQPVLNDGRVFDHPAVVTTFTSLDESIATVEGDTLTAKSAGTVRIKVESKIQNTDNAVTGYLDVDIKAEAMREIEVTAGGASWIRLTDKENDTAPMFISAITSAGNPVELSDGDIEIEALTPELAAIVNKSDILPVSEGTAKFRVTARHGGAVVSREIELPVIRGKSEASYMTAKKAAAARENVKKYDWAESIAEKYVTNADKFVDKLDFLYDAIVSEGIPRSLEVGLWGDPNCNTCRYCNTNIQKKYGNYKWVHNPFSRPWKIQCPECKRLFPSNDFESFYKLGLNEYGEFDRMRALNAHRELYGDKSVTEPGVEHSAQWKAYYGYGNPDGFLYNEMYKEIGDKDENGNYKVKTINAGEGLREGETVETWGVDDGEGYVPAHSDGTPYYAKGTLQEVHPYIAEYLFFGVWRSSGIITTAVNQCANAYFYTGEKEYGRVAAILLDRLADFYPGYDTRQFRYTYHVNGKGNPLRGKLVGSIWDTAEADGYITAYDMVYDMYEDEFVLDYIGKKAKQYKMRYAKETPSQIRTNIEDGLVREALRGVKEKHLWGNNGMAEKTNAIAAVVLDTQPETDEWLDYLESTGGYYKLMVDVIDNDGQAQEAAYYNTYQLDNLRLINELFESNEKYEKHNFANHPKYVKMHYANIPLMSSYYTPQIGDSHSTAGKSHWTKTEEALSGWRITGDPIFARVMYLLNGNKTEGLKYDIFENDPERLEDEVAAVIEEHGTLNLTSEMMPHFGFAMLRYGVNNTAGNSATAQDTRRDAWMYFGSNAWNSGSHAHFDTLNLGMTAYGLNLLPDLGYPARTNSSEQVEWNSATISHNTVVVNEKNQSKNAEARGEALHFEDDGTVSLMDVEASYVYKATDSYRRSVVSVKVDDENAYAVDFFRVLGGDSHLYSFHVQGNEINETKGLDFTVVEDENGNYVSGSQLDENGNYKGTYAGRDAKYVKNTVTGDVRIPSEEEASGKAALGENEKLFDITKGPDPHLTTSTETETLYPRGYTWLDRIDRDTSPEAKFEVDFAIKDFRKVMKAKKSLSLRLTMLNESNVEKGASASAAIANGYPPAKEDNNEIPSLKYLLVENKGSDLDTVFTSVIEPYSGERYLEGSYELPMNAVGDVPENEGDAHRAVKVKHKDGRVDYILWSTNNKVTYEITLEDGTALSFRGFAGVYTVQNGRCTYQFLNDGDILGETKDVQGAIEGTVKSFTQGAELTFDNEIVITLSNPREYTEEELNALENKYIYVDNGLTTRGGTYKIEGVTQSGDDLIVDVGMVTLARKYVDETDYSKGFVYCIKEGQSARIPLTASQNSDPVFVPMNTEISTSAGSSVTVQVKAFSPIEDAPPSISYEGTVLPRGASINTETGAVTWKPTGSQVGENHFAITAHDSDGRESTIHFTVTVYGATTGSSSSENNTTTETPSTGASGGGGGGGGGAAPTDEKDNVDDSSADAGGGDFDDPNTADSAQTEGTDNGDSDVPQFTDLTNHEWAAGAINALAAENIIKGTTSKTYSPENNITRADFALLLVRAFNLASDNNENFADVSASDYFASELAIARNTGIVQGIGENKFAPRNHITRQDMMVIVYRALEKLGAGFGESIEPQYPDYTDVAEYAKPAVSALIGAEIVNGKNGNIAPADYTTRAEVAVLIRRILDYTKK